MENKNFEWLTEEICAEYRERANELTDNGGEDTGAWRALRIELQERCNLAEIEAVNILRGNHVQQYLTKYGILSGRIEMPEAMKKKLKEQASGRKKPTKELVEEYEERIAYLEELAGEKADDFAFEEMD